MTPDEEVVQQVGGVTVAEVVGAIDWVGNAFGDRLSFTSADYVDASKGVIRLEGRKDDLLVDVTLRILSIATTPDWDDIGEEDDDD